MKLPPASLIAAMMMLWCEPVRV